MGTAAEAAREFVSGPRALDGAHKLLEQFPLAALCEALGNAQPSDAEILLEALGRLAELKEIRDGFLVDPALAPFLAQGAGAADVRVRRLVAQLVLSFSGDEASAALLADKPFLSLCEELLLDKETGPGDVIAKALCNASAMPGPFAAIVDGEAEGGLVQDLLQRLPAMPEVQRIRVLHFFVDLGRTSEATFAALQRRGCYKEVMGAFLTEDILLKLNAVELMDALSAFQAGQEFLTTEGIPERLARELVDPMNDASVRVCVANLLGVVLLRAPASLATLLPGQDAPLARTLADFLDSRDPAERLCMLNAWAHISWHDGGLAFFLRWKELMRGVVAAAAAPHQDVCKGAMACWASVLERWVAAAGEPTQMADVGDDGSAPSQLWDLAERELLPLALKNLPSKPFPEVREQSWHLMAALSRSRAAAQRALAAEEMRDLLLDFSSETKSPARIAKHDFIASLVKHQGDLVDSFLDEGVGKLLREYARQGPFWAPRDAAAAVGDMGA